MPVEVRMSSPLNQVTDQSFSNKRRRYENHGSTDYFRVNVDTRPITLSRTIQSAALKNLHFKNCNKKNGDTRVVLLQRLHWYSLLVEAKKMTINHI